MFPQGLQVLRVLERVFFKMLHISRAASPRVPKDSCWQRKMRRKIQWRGSKRTLCNLKRRDLMPRCSCFSPFFFFTTAFIVKQLVSELHKCWGEALAACAVWSAALEQSVAREGERQGGETTSGHCNFLSLSVVRRSFSVCRCFVYIRILRHAACRHILYQAAVEMDSRSKCWGKNSTHTRRATSLCVFKSAPKHHLLPLPLTPWQMLTLSDIVVCLRLLMFYSCFTALNSFCLDLKCISSV